MRSEEPDLEDSRALKDDQHEQREETVVPVLVEAPQSDTEDLEDEEGRDGVLRKEFCKGRDGDVEDVLAKVVANRVDDRGRVQSGRGLEGRKGGGFVAGVGDAGE